MVQRSSSNVPDSNNSIWLLRLPNRAGWADPRFQFISNLPNSLGENVAFTKSPGLMPYPTSHAVTLCRQPAPPEGYHGASHNQLSLPFEIIYQCIEGPVTPFNTAIPTILHPRFSVAPNYHPSGHQVTTVYAWLPGVPPVYWFY